MGSGNALFPPLQSVINACIICVHLPGPVPRIETSVRHGPAHRGLLVVGPGGGLGPKSGCRLGCGDPWSAVSPPWGRLGGLCAGATWHLAPTGCQAAGERLGSMSSLWAQQLHLAGEALATPRCSLRPTSSSLLSWTCSCFCLFHTALP